VLQSRLVAGRARAHELDAEQLAGRRERDADVRAVADPGHADAVEGAEALADRQQVGERLQRVLVVRQRIDHRHGRDRGQLVDLGLRSRADGERVEVAGEHAGRVAERLAARELQLGRGQVDRRAAELGDRDGQRHASPRRALAEEQAERAALQEAVRLAGGALSLQLVGEVEHGVELGSRQVGDPRQRPAAQVDAERSGQGGHPRILPLAAATAARASAGPGAERRPGAGGSNVPARTCAATAS
jgi:hypothetical protein